MTVKKRRLTSQRLKKKSVRASKAGIAKRRVKIKIPIDSFFTPASGSELPLTSRNESPIALRPPIPRGYGDHRIVLQVRDPWWLHAYWELSPRRISEKEQQLNGRELQIQKWILRVYPPEGWFDIDLDGKADNWYIQVEDNSSYVVEIGILASDSSFHPLARSNRVRTPRFGMSDVIDSEWMCLGEDYWKVFALSGGFGVGSSQMGASVFKP